MSKKMEKITSRDVDFAQWYTDVVKNSGLIDYGPVKGTMIFKPYGYAIWENIQRIMDAQFKKLGVTNVYFPLLIPASLFNKEKDHIEGFAPEVATVTKVGDKVLAEELYIRPTSETLIVDHFAKEVKSYRDLPLLYNQWTSVMRWEKTTRPFLRSSEFLWQEGHTIHSSKEEARNFTLNILDLYATFARETLSLPVISGRKTEKEKFAGAKETYTIEALMYDGQSLQSGTSHYFEDNFAKAFNIKFQNKEQKEEFGYTTSWGMSTRIIGAIIMTHADDFGLVLPSKVAPIQVQIININESDEVVNTSKQLFDQLVDDYRVNIDKTDKSFGFKISEAEIKGIPLRIEVGPRDLANGVVTISRRDIRSKEQIKLEDVKTYIDTQIQEYDKNIYNIALQNREQRTFKASTIEEYMKLLDEKQGFVLVPFCGEISCENDIKEKTQTNSRCIPDGVEQTKSKCFNCQKESNNMVYFARAY
ncbi:proline--tRNA ligase [Spiroplasma culicicola]|uniref:Proline--tRNA ligase n=1 Tax=Spiroplasma culicicola AES-1 TaxID=1276246 RepID=W6AFR5_9MOLU|nr:proline--tRNA ligase [Spiroplasma culicicola]AHI52549.1 prolyl-tRNA synthetase [Spiroplasma culicicola AES-1]